MNETIVTDYLKYGTIQGIVEGGKPSITTDSMSKLMCADRVDVYDYYKMDCFTLCLHNGNLIDITLYIKYYSKAYTGIRLRYGAELHTVLSKLRSFGINWEFDQRFTFNDQLSILTEGGVNLVFGSKNEKIQLMKIASFYWFNNLLPA